jgi:glucosamine-6-phosphate deaminase
MEVVITPTDDHAAALVADIIERLLNNVERPVLGVATGSSPLPTYREIVQRHAAGRMSFAGAELFLLDEYVGLVAAHPEAYRSFIEREFTNQLDLPNCALHGPDGSLANLPSAAADYEAALMSSGGVDVQLLGIGGDGHIGFNEPGSSLGSRTRLKTLTDSTRADNARFFADDIEAVPRHVLTQGVGTILDAHHLVMIATGESKAAPIARAVEGPVTSMVPASALQLHPHVTVVLDELAAKNLTNADYYRETFRHKPSWQQL